MEENTEYVRLQFTGAKPEWEAGVAGVGVTGQGSRQPGSQGAGVMQRRPPKPEGASLQGDTGLKESGQNGLLCAVDGVGGSCPRRETVEEGMKGAVKHGGDAHFVSLLGNG